MTGAVIKASVFKSMVDALSALVDEAKINITSEGWTVYAVDPANVGLVNLLLDKGAFESYELEAGVIAIDIVRLEKIIKGAGKDELIEIQFNPETKKLELKNGAYSYKLSLLDPSSVRKEPKLPNLELPATITLSGALLKKAVAEAAKVCDNVRLKTTNESFIMEAMGDLDEFSVEHPATALISLEAPATGTRTCFSLDYIKDVVKVLGEADRVTIRLGTDYPGKFTMPLAGGAGTVTYMIAPRVESE